MGKTHLRWANSACPPPMSLSLRFRRTPLVQEMLQAVLKGDLEALKKECKRRMLRSIGFLGFRENYMRFIYLNQKGAI